MADFAYNPTELSCCYFELYGYNFKKIYPRQSKLLLRGYKVRLEKVFPPMEVSVFLLSETSTLILVVMN